MIINVVSFCMLFYTPKRVLKSPIMCNKPSSNLIFGSQPNTFIALEMSGFLLDGSSCVFSLKTISASPACFCGALLFFFFLFFMQNELCVCVFFRAFCHKKEEHTYLSLLSLFLLRVLCFFLNKKEEEERRSVVQKTTERRRESV